MNPDDLDRIARAHGIRLLLQFGSTVTGLVHAKSDVDVAVLLERSRQTPGERGAMVHDLQVLFPDRELDLAILNHAGPLFLKQVMDTAGLPAVSGFR